MVKIDKDGHCRSLTQPQAKDIVHKMLKRDRDWNGPDFEMFTTVQRRALAILAGGIHIEDFDR